MNRKRSLVGMAAAILGLTAGTAVAQLAVSHATVPDGYTLHESVDLGGRIANIYGSDAMYKTLIDQQSGPRIMGETFELRALPDTKHTLVDHLKTFISGIGGEPESMVKLDASKGKLYEFSGLFRRDRQYFDYNLLGNPNIPAGQSIPTGPTAKPTGSYAWPQVMQSPFMSDTVRRMTDTNLTLLPLSKVTFRLGYSQNIFQGPSLSPSGYDFGQSPLASASNYTLLQEHQRNSTDDFTASAEWKPISGTRLTYEEQITHYKGDSYFTMAPQYMNLQEANGTRVAVFQNYDNPLLKPVGITCSSLVGTSSISQAQSPNGLPVVDPACYVISSYSRSQPTRVFFPTEMFRLQSSSIKNVTMNGNFRYTYANMSMPNYYDDFQGFVPGVAVPTKQTVPPTVPSWTREATYVGNASAKREAIAADYGITWQVWKKFSISDQVDYSNVHQPGTANMTSATAVYSSTGTINNLALTTDVITTPTTLIPGKVPATAAASSTFSGSPNVATPQFDFFGQKFITNNVTAQYDATDRTTFTLTYHHQQHTIGEGTANTTSYLSGIETFTINEDGVILGVAVRPTKNWNINGSAEIQYADNVLTPVAPRQLKHYRVHTTYRPKTWATFSGAFNDLERHNNTGNSPATYIAGDGPLQHVDHSRTVSFNADLMPNEHYGFDFSYAYSDVYTATNTCFLGTASSATIPGAATPTGTYCPQTGTPRSGYTYGPAKDFMDAPTQFASVALAVSPVVKVHANIGYRLSSVSGSRFFNDPRDVNGSLVSTYQSPFVNLSYAMQKNLIWKAEYNYFGYGEGGRSGAQYCSTSTAGPTPTTPAAVVPCSTLPNTAINGPAYGFTAPRNFHANNVTLGLHYEF